MDSVVIEVQSSNGLSVGSGDLFGALLEWADRISIHRRLEASLPTTSVNALVLRGGDGDGDVALFGEAGNDTLWGGTGQDTLTGDYGDDLLYGGANDDEMLWGGFGNDTLIGGDDVDALMGGNGNDLLTGGAGDDWIAGGRGHVFFYYYHAGADRIADFKIAVDMIHISTASVNFGNLQMSQNGNDVVISLKNGQVTLVNVDLIDLGVDNFLFG